MFDAAALRARLESVRDRIARAAGRARRDPASIQLLAVSKTFKADWVRAAADAGQIDFAENKVQEASEKMREVSSLPLRWHLIGHLQSNKARRAAALFNMIHSVDSAALLAKLDHAATEEGRTVDVLVQVDLAGEATQHGVPPDKVFEILEAARDYQAALVRGLMTIPPAVAAPEAARPYFASLRTLQDALRTRGVNPLMLQELSMGMSFDFDVAIEEGSTLVRVGSAIFGERGHVSPGPVGSPEFIR